MAITVRCRCPLQNAGILLQVELCPSEKKRYIEVPIPGTSECDVIWRQGLYRDHRVKSMSLGWLEPNMTGVLMKREDVDTEIHT